MNKLSFARISISQFVINNKSVSMSHINGMKFNIIGNNRHTKNNNTLFSFKKAKYRYMCTISSINDAMSDFEDYCNENSKDLAFLADNSDSKYNPYNRLSSFK